MKVLILFLIWVTSLPIVAQEPPHSILTLGEVIELAKENHPIMKQASLQKGFADAELRKAKGSFDPKISSSFDSKDLNGADYYRKFKNTLKIPVWFPVDPKVEIYHNQGEYLNPENYVSSSSNYWQMTAGISIPIGKGLFIDERRTLVKQAQYYGELAEAEQIKLINKTLLDITKSYWDWYLGFQEYQLMERSMGIAQTLFDRVKMNYQFGEAAVVDTVQAYITYQARAIDFEKAKLDYTQARLMMGIHLWGPDNIPLELTETVLPQNMEPIEAIYRDSSANLLIEWAINNHPDIIKLSAKENQLKIEEKWNKESLKPSLDLSYSLIDSPINYQGAELPQWQNNYKLGLDFSFPIFLRKERGNLQKTQLYLQQITYDRLQLQQNISANISRTLAELATNNTLVKQYESMAQSYERLLNAELFNLENGESDLFKLNIQQDKYIESRMKYLQIRVKYEKLKATLPYAAGLPYLSYQKLYE